jgi:osmotically inducible lipoprotein OsmB
MNSLNRTAGIVIAFAMAGNLVACSGMSRQDKNTAYGAAAGGAAGAVLSGGSVLGTAGGAAVGGAIGHVVSDDDDDK